MKLGQISTMDLPLPSDCYVISIEACEQCALEYAGIPLQDETITPKGEVFTGWPTCLRPSSSSSSYYPPPTDPTCVPRVEIVTLPDGSVVTRIFCEPAPGSSSSSSVDCSAYIECNPFGTIFSGCGASPEPGHTYYFDCVRCECIDTPSGSSSSASNPGENPSNSSSSPSSKCSLGSMPPSTTEYCWDGRPYLNTHYMPDFAACEWSPIITVFDECPNSSSSSCYLYTRHCLYLAASASLRITSVFSQEEKPPPCDYKTYCCPEGCITQCECKGACTDDLDCPNGCLCKNGYCKSPCGTPAESPDYCSNYCCSEGICAIPCIEYFSAGTCTACYAAAQDPKYMGLSPLWFQDTQGFGIWWRDNCECYGPCSYDGQCNQGCYCCNGQCSDTPCSCDVCCGLDYVLFSDPGDINSPGATPAAVIFQYVDSLCDSPTNVPTSYQLSVVEMGTYDEVSMIFYCGDFTFEGLTIPLELLEGGITWQDVPSSLWGTRRRPSGFALYRFSDNSMGKACCVQIDFNPSGGTAENPGSASVKFRSGCGTSSSSSSSSADASSSSMTDNPPGSSSTEQQKYWECTFDQGCQESQYPTGTYTSLTDCQNNCGQYWNCTYDGCQQNTSFGAKMPWEYSDETSCKEVCKQYWSCTYSGCEQNYIFSTKMPWEYDDETSCKEVCKQYWECNYYSGCQQSAYFGTKQYGQYDDDTSCNLTCKQYWDCTSGGCEQNVYFSEKDPGYYDDSTSCAKECVARFNCDYYQGCTPIGISDNPSFFTDCSTNCFASAKWCNPSEGCDDLWTTSPPETTPTCPPCERFWECSYGLPCAQSSQYTQSGLSQADACGNCIEFFYCDNSERCKSYWNYMYNPGGGFYESKSTCESACQTRYFCSVDTCTPYGYYVYGDDEDACKASCPPYGSYGFRIHGSPPE